MGGARDGSPHDAVREAAASKVERVVGVLLGALLAPLATRIRPHRERERGEATLRTGRDQMGRRRPTLDDGFVKAKQVFSSPFFSFLYI